MELQVARQIIDTLAQGIHPVTGEAMPEDSPYNAPPVIRALHAVGRALDEQPAAGPAAVEAAPAKPAAGKPPSRARPAPVNAGKPWATEDDAALVAGFDAGVEPRQLAESLGRTRFGIEQRLIKLGKMEAPAGGGRYGSAVASVAAVAAD